MRKSKVLSHHLRQQQINLTLRTNQQLISIDLAFPLENYFRIAIYSLLVKKIKKFKKIKKTLPLKKYPTSQWITTYDVTPEPTHPFRPNFQSTVYTGIKKQAPMARKFISQCHWKKREGCRLKTYSPKNQIKSVVLSHLLVWTRRLHFRDYINLSMDWLLRHM